MLLSSYSTSTVHYDGLYAFFQKIQMTLRLILGNKQRMEGQWERLNYFSWAGNEQLSVKFKHKHNGRLHIEGDCVHTAVSYGSLIIEMKVYIAH